MSPAYPNSEPSSDSLNTYANVVIDGASGVSSDGSGSNHLMLQHQQQRQLQQQQQQQTQQHSSNLEGKTSDCRLVNIFVYY